jgi:hypothetical protein
VADEKYVVYRRGTAGEAVGKPLEDAIVLRKQDLTVAPLMHAYSSMILSFIETLSSVGVLSEDDRDSLREIADWAHNEATDAEVWPDRRLPD